MGASWLLLDYDVVHFRHHINLDTGDVRLHIVVEPVLEVIPALPYPVSYTHLDVYKRQLKKSLGCQSALSVRFHWNRRPTRSLVGGSRLSEGTTSPCVTSEMCPYPVLRPAVAPQSPMIAY